MEKKSLRGSNAAERSESKNRMRVNTELNVKGSTAKYKVALMRAYQDYIEGLEEVPDSYTKLPDAGIIASEAAKVLAEGSDIFNVDLLHWCEELATDKEGVRNALSVLNEKAPKRDDNAATSVQPAPKAKKRLRRKQGYCKSNSRVRRNKMINGRVNPSTSVYNSRQEGNEA